MSKMSQLHASMHDSYSMGVEDERERVLTIIKVGLQVADIVAAVDVLKMLERMVSDGVEIHADKKSNEQSETSKAFDSMFNTTDKIDLLSIRPKEDK